MKFCSRFIFLVMGPVCTVPASRGELTAPLDDGSTIEVAISLEVQTGPISSVPPLLPVPVLPGSQVKISIHGLPPTSISDVSWAKDRVDLGVRGSELTLARAGAADTGEYLATVTTVGGDVILASRGLHVAAFPRQRLLNLSTRAAITTGGPIVIAGFVVDAGLGDAASSKQLLIRAVGPSLREYGVSDALPDPALRLFRADGSVVSVGPSVVDPENIAAAVQLTGAAPLHSGGDVAWLISLRGGVYTAQVSSVGNRSGEVLVEIYEVPR